MGEDREGGADVEALRLTRSESRAVLDHQLALMNDLDDKAMRTVRTAVILLAILVSAGGVAGPKTLGGLSPGVITAFGSALAGLFVTIFVGIGTYTVSDMEYGIGPAHRDEVQSGAYSEREWLSLLLDEYDRWTATMRDRNDKNAWYVFTTQVALGWAVLSLAAAATLLTFAG